MIENYYFLTDFVSYIDLPLFTNYKHPVIRYYAKGKLAATHHIIEDLETVWKEEVHRIPLLNFLSRKKEQKQEKLQAVK